MRSHLARILFVCVENSCRSQIAEGFARQLGRGVLEPASAGSRPSGKVNPKAVAAMRERGIDISSQQSKGLDQFAGDRWDYVVTMGCGDACPFVPSKARLDWQIPDPKEMDQEQFSRVCDMIEAKVRALVDENKV